MKPTTLGALAGGVAVGAFTGLWRSPNESLVVSLVGTLFFVVDRPAMWALIKEHGLIGSAFTRTYTHDVMPPMLKRMIVFGLAWLLTAGSVNSLARSLLADHPSDRAALPAPGPSIR